MSLELELKVGDKVTFEVSQRTPQNTARWIFEKEKIHSGERWVFKDTTGNGVWADAQVAEIKDNLIKTSFTIPGMIGGSHTWWPAKGNKYYNPEQWTWAGFLNVVSQCECGSESVYGSSTIHAAWCPKYEEV